MVEVKTGAVRSPAVIHRARELSCSYNDVLHIPPSEFVTGNKKKKAIIIGTSKWVEPRIISSLSSVIFQVSVVLKNCGC